MISVLKISLLGLQILGLALPCSDSDAEEPKKTATHLAKRTRVDAIHFLPGNDFHRITLRETPAPHRLHAGQEKILQCLKKSLNADIEVLITTSPEDSRILSCRESSAR